MNPIVCNFRISQKEYVKLMMGRYFRNPIIIAYYGGAGLLVLLILFQVLTMKGKTTMLSAIGIFITLYFALRPFLMSFMHRKTYTAYHFLQEQTKCTFTNATINIERESQDSKIEFSTITKVEEIKEWFLFYITKREMVIVPKSGFSSENDISRLRALLKTMHGMKLKLRGNN